MNAGGAQHAAEQEEIWNQFGFMRFIRFMGFIGFMRFAFEGTK